MMQQEEESAVADCLALPKPMRSCYGTSMLKSRIRKKAAHVERAAELYAEVTASVHALGNEDLLDLADIFSADATTTLSKIASVEMQRRGLSL